MITIKCAKCKQKVFKYVKIGKGKLWHCWKERIIEDLSVKTGKNIYCKCGNLIGVEENKWIKLKQHSISTTGTKIG
jgi:hypothetical protein